jgi:phosphoribosylanthranilate isomerase
MDRVRTKICGLTRPEDAAACAALGVDYLGIVFASSPRQISERQARDVRAAVPRVASGAASGAVSGAASGAVSGAASGAASGAVSGVASGAVSGAASGAVSGAASGAVSAVASGPLLVGVFVDAPLEQVVHLVRAVALDVVQLHGRESAAFAQALRQQCPVRIIHALAPRGDARDWIEDPAAHPEADGPDKPDKPDRPDGADGPDGPDKPDGADGPDRPDGADFLLLDLPKDLPKDLSPGERSARQAALWRFAAREARRGERIFLAGGLTPTNVRAAIEAVGPFAVDVAGGVECQPGIKDREKVAAFLKEVHTCR